uniref:recombinase family protein n=1 Tax=Microbulbifer pacificus TaxID=407164 RepID=UPI0018F8AE2F
FLRNDRYIGTIRFNTHMSTADGKRVPRPESEHIIVHDAHPPIIDMDTWNRVQDRIEKRDVPLTNTKLDFDPCELAGICVCSKCGRKMVRQSSTQHYKKKDGSINVYHKEFLWCTTVGCTFVKYRSIEEDLLETLKQIAELDQNTLSKSMENMTVNDIDNKGFSTEEIQNNIKIRKEDLERRMKFIYEKFESGIYDDDMFLKRKAELDKEKEEIDKIKIEDEKEESIEPVDPLNFKSTVNSVLDAYGQASHKSDKNIILKKVFHHVDVEILEKGRGRKPAIHKIRPHLRSSFVAKGI